MFSEYGNCRTLGGFRYRPTEGASLPDCAVARELANLQFFSGVCPAATSLYRPLKYLFAVTFVQINGTNYYLCSYIFYF